MQTLSFLKKLTVLIVLIVTIAFVHWLDGTPPSRLLAAESPLAQPGLRWW